MEADLLAIQLRQASLVVVAARSAEHVRNALAWAPADAFIVEVPAQRAAETLGFVKAQRSDNTALYAVAPSGGLDRATELRLLALGCRQLWSTPLSAVAIAQQIWSAPKGATPLPASGPELRGVSGDFRYQPLTYVIQTCRRHRVSARLHARLEDGDGDDWGVILMRDGEMIDAETPRLRGKAAAVEWLGRAEHRFVLHPLPDDAADLQRPDVIQEDVARLLMRALHRSDAQAGQTPMIAAGLAPSHPQAALGPRSAAVAHTSSASAQRATQPKMSAETRANLKTPRETTAPQSAVSVSNPSTRRGARPETVEVTASRPPQQAGRSGTTTAPRTRPNSDTTASDVTEANLAAAPNAGHAAKGRTRTADGVPKASPIALDHPIAAAEARAEAHVKRLRRAQAETERQGDEAETEERLGDEAETERQGDEAETERQGGEAETERLGGEAETERLGGEAGTERLGDEAERPDPEASLSGRRRDTSPRARATRGNLFVALAPREDQGGSSSGRRRIGTRRGRIAMIAHEEFETDGRAALAVGTSPNQDSERRVESSASFFFEHPRLDSVPTGKATVIQKDDPTDPPHEAVRAETTGFFVNPKSGLIHLSSLGRATEPPQGANPSLAGLPRVNLHHSQLQPARRRHPTSAGVRAEQQVVLAEQIADLGTEEGFEPPRLGGHLGWTTGWFALALTIGILVFAFYPGDDGGKNNEINGKQELPQAVITSLRPSFLSNTATVPDLKRLANALVQVDAGPVEIREVLLGATRLAPSDVDVLAWLAVLARAQGHSDEFEAWRAKADLLAPEHPEVQRLQALTP